MKWEHEWNVGWCKACFLRLPLFYHQSPAQLEFLWKCSLAWLLIEINCLVE
jgi:hypothetical protein